MVCITLRQKKRKDATKARIIIETRGPARFHIFCCCCSLKRVVISAKLLPMVTYLQMRQNLSGQKKQPDPRCENRGAPKQQARESILLASEIT